MHIIIWEFTVYEEHIQEFVSGYASDGDWAQLFQRAEGYIGTELLRSAQQADVFLTIDRWESAARFDRFRERFGAEYRALDNKFASYTSSEEKVGVYMKSQ